MTPEKIIEKINEVILFPVMSFMLSVALLFFLWGAYEFVASAESDEGRARGKTHMMYGIIGMLVMLSALAILKIAAGTFGVPVPD
jgi:hypothetical protein